MLESKDNNLIILKKKLLYRSIHRGCKETDFLVGEFAKENIDKMNNEQLANYQNFLAENDVEIYDWLLNKEFPPLKYKELINKIKEFHLI
jgi:antitoxin CptB